MTAVPRISIGLPVYNGAPSMRRTIDSLLAQTERDFELIISDNASTDDTGRVAAEYAGRDGRVRVVRQATNIGAFGNFGAVLAAARGEYFMWAAADDHYDPSHLADLVAQLNSCPQAVVAMSGTRLSPDDGGIPYTVVYEGKNDPNRLSRAGLAWRIAGGGLYHLYIYGLFRSGFLRQAFSSLPSVRGSDRLFIWRIALGHRFRYSGKVTYFRHASKVPAYRRYKASDPQLARQYGSNRAYLETVRVAARYLSDAPGTSPLARALLPLMIARFALFLATAVAKERCRPLLARWRRSPVES